MNRTSHTIRRKLGLVALSLTVAAVAAPAAVAGGGGDSGVVPSKLGSLDPRDTMKSQQQSVQIQPEAGLVASVLGSPDTRDAALRSDGKDAFRNAAQEHGASGYGS
jgi:hypothetical protein